MTNELLDNTPNPVPEKINIPAAGNKVKLGSERVLESEIELLQGKRIGIVTNHSGFLPTGKHIVDALRDDSDITVGALFSPEHGIRGDAPAGKHVEHEIDPSTGLQVYSLYGDHTKPEKWMLDKIEVLVYDVQDVGTRFYTYISTMTLAMEAAAENNIPFVVLDRPLITSGDLIDGPVLKDDLRSFIGMLPIPVLYNLTPGELAGLVRQEYLYQKKLEIDLHIVKVENYSRSMWYDETGLAWIIPSPNIPTIDTAIIYPGAALVEGTNVSEGRGTPFPFQYIGAPFIKKMELADFLNGLEMPGVRFNSIDFTPRDVGAVANPRFKDQLCHGVDVQITDRRVIKPVEVGIAIICAIKGLHPGELTFRADGAFDRLVGDKNVRLLIEKGLNYREIAATWESGLKDFGESRKKYFLY